MEKMTTNWSVVDGKHNVNLQLDSIIRSMGLCEQFRLNSINLTMLTKNEIAKLDMIFKNFGVNVKEICFFSSCLAENDIRHMLSYLPNVLKISILSNNDQTPRVIFQQKHSTLKFPLLQSINFSSFSRGLQFEKVFKNIVLTNNFKKLYVTLPQPSYCYWILKENPSIEEVSISSKFPIDYLPIEHLKLNKLTLLVPMARRLLPIAEQHKELSVLNIESDSDSSDESSYSSDSTDTNDSNKSNEPIEINDLDSDAKLLKCIVTIENLTQLSLTIDYIPDNSFHELMNLKRLNLLSVKSANLRKINAFSTILMPSVQQLLLRFKIRRVPNNTLLTISMNFPNVTDLTYDVQEYFCDAYLCFVDKFKLLNKLSMTVNSKCDYRYSYLPSTNCLSKRISHSLKSFTLFVAGIVEVELSNLHLFMIRLGFTAPNLEHLWIETSLGLKFNAKNFSYILRNFKNLKQIDIGYDLYPDNVERLRMTSFDMLKSSTIAKELDIISAIDEYGENFDIIKISLSTPHDLQEETWSRLKKYFSSILVKQTEVVLKKDESADSVFYF